MIVKVIKSDGTVSTQEVNTFSEISRLVGGSATKVGELNPFTDLFGNEKGSLIGLPVNDMFPQFVGDLVATPPDWKILPYE